MPPTFDVFRADDGDLVLIVTDVAEAPTVHDVVNDRSVTLAPARLDWSGMFPTITSTYENTGCWFGELEHDRVGKACRRNPGGPAGRPPSFTLLPTAPPASFPVDETAARGAPSSPETEAIRGNWG